MKTLTVAQSITVAKAEIKQDIKAGVVSKSVKSFSDLHDWVDANNYGGGFSVNTEHFTIDQWETVQTALDTWLHNGRK